MTTKKRGLGRGLDALLGVAQAGTHSAETPGAEAPVPQVTELALDLLQRGRHQPRMDFDPVSLQELADSISAQGVVQPILVRPLPQGRYEIIAGERRWRASQLAGKHEIPVVVRDVSDQTAIAMALIENIQREDLNAIEEATALHRLLDEFELTHQEVACAVGKSRTTVTNLLRLLELNGDVKQMIETGQLEMGHARALLALKGDLQSRAGAQVCAQGLSVRETERLVRRLLGAEPGQRKSTEPPRLDPDVRRLQDDLCERLGAQVSIQPGAQGRGRLVIAYNTLEELDGILERIR